MKREFYKTTAMQWKYTFLLIALMCLNAINAWAQPSGSRTSSDPYLFNFVEGNIYPIPIYKDIHATFTSEKNGLLKIRSSRPNIYQRLNSTDSNWDAASGGLLPTAFDNENRCIQFLKVEKGKTYYFSTFSLMTDTFSISTEADAKYIPLAFRNVTPKDGATFSPNADEIISLDFNQDITCSTATLTFGNESYPIAVHSWNNGLSIEPKSVLLDLKSKGIIKPGDTFKVTISNILSTFDASNYIKELSFSYKLDSDPVKLVSTSKGEGAELLSYYLPNDKSGNIVLTFDGELLDNSKVKEGQDSCSAAFYFGNIENAEDFYHEVLPCQISGKTVTIPLQGKRRRDIDMIPGNVNQYEEINLRITGLRDKNGKMVEGTFAGGVSYDYKLKNLDYDVYADFTPASGSCLKNIDSLEVWIKNALYTTFDGIKYTYVYNGQETDTTITNNNIRCVMDGSDAVYHIPVPEITADANSKINVAFVNLLCADGIDKNIGAEYEATEKPKLSDVKFVSITPESDSKIERSEREFTLAFDGAVTLSEKESFVNLGSGMREAYESITGSDDKKTWTIKVSETTMNNEDYSGLSLTVVAYDVANNYRVLGNTGEDETTYFSFNYTFPGVDPDSVSPAPNSFVDSLHTIILTYKGNVSVDYNCNEDIKLFNMQRDLIATVTSMDPIPSDPENPYSDAPQIKLTLDKTVTESGSYFLQIPEARFIIENNWITKSSNGEYYRFLIKGATSIPTTYNPIEVSPADSSKIERLDTITLTMPDENVCLNDFAPKEATLYDADNNSIATGTIQLNPNDYSDLHVYVVLDKAVTQKGIYTLVIPEASIVNIDYNPNSMTGACNAEQRYTYYINMVGIPTVKAQEDELVRVYTTTGIEVASGKLKDALKKLSKGIYIVKGKKLVID